MRTELDTIEILIKDIDIEAEAQFAKEKEKKEKDDKDKIKSKAIYCNIKYRDNVDPKSYKNNNKDIKNEPNLN